VDVFELNIRDRCRSHVATRSCPRNPWRWCILPVRRNHEETWVSRRIHDVCPILKRGGKAVEELAAWRIEPAETVSNRLSMFVTVYARLRRDDVIRRVRLQRGMVIGHQHAIARDEIQKVGHLFEIGGDVWIVAGEVNVVELNINYVLDLSPCRVQLAGAIRPRTSSTCCGQRPRFRWYRKYSASDRRKNERECHNDGQRLLEPG